VSARGPVLSVRDLRIEFRGDHGTVRAVDGVDLDLVPGRVAGLVGESGSGKSTVAMGIMGLLPRAGRVVGGRVEHGGRDLLRLRESEMRRLRGTAIAMIFQDPMTSLTPWLSVRTQLFEALRAHLHLDRGECEARARELLDAVGIPDPAAALDKYPHEFSGGQRQRVLIAIALSCDPDILVADEPTTALDVTVQARILALLKRLQRDRDLAMLLVTHDMGVVAGMCDRVSVMRRGAIVEHAACDDLFANPRHPYTRELLAAVPRFEAPSILGSEGPGARGDGEGGTVP